jgi:hypothetical protein
MNGKKARQIRKFLKMKQKNKDNSKYEHIIVKEDQLVGRKYKIKHADLASGTAEAEREDSYGDKLQMVNADKTEMMYRAIKKDYYTNPDEIRAGLKQHSKEKDDE